MKQVFFSFAKSIKNHWEYIEYFPKILNINDLTTKLLFLLLILERLNTSLSEMSQT